MATRSLELERRKAEIWDNPEGLNEVELQRLPLERALRKIVSAVFSQYLPVGSSVFEVGAGTGYLKDLVPPEYHSSYVSSDYNIRNLQAGLKRRQLHIRQASAYDLPLPDDSEDCVVDMDAYDTLPNLYQAMKEARRVLRPGGVFIHFQANYPSDDTVQEECPDYIFFPARRSKSHPPGQMIGMTRENFVKGIAEIKTP